MPRHASAGASAKTTTAKRRAPGVSLFSDRSGITIGSSFDRKNDVTLYHGDCLDLLESMPAGVAELVVTSPPYNIGKEYEKRLDVDSYVAQQAKVIGQCVRILSARGSICWQVGNYVDRGSIIPLDTLLYPVFAKAGLVMRNRIIWHFEHGLHCIRAGSPGATRRSSGSPRVTTTSSNSTPFGSHRSTLERSTSRAPRLGSTPATRSARIQVTSGSSPTLSTITWRRPLIRVSSRWS